jgi:REase_MTES_1575
MGWADQARSQAGVITRAQLSKHGVTTDSVRRLLGNGGLTPVHHGVHLVRGAPLSYEARTWAAVLATGGVVGFASAAHLWGIIDRPPSRINVIAARGPHIHTPTGVRLHRIDLRAGCTERRHGLPITTRLTTVLDYLGRLRPDAADDFADRAIQQGWLERHDLEYRFRSQPGRTGNVTLRRVFDQTSDRAAARSERIVHGLLRRAGITDWVANYDVWHEGRLLGVIDIALVELRIAIEVDGWAFHSASDRFQRDRTKDNALSVVGWKVVRFTWADITQRPGHVVNTVRRMIAAVAA